ncbi:MAG: type II secretion system F family protein, partial [Patescibacteria group bacterium]
MEYEYRSVTKDGQKKSGVKDAASQTDLARGLREEGYFLISATEKSQSASPMQAEGAKSSSWIKKDFSFENIFKSVSLQEKMLFSRHLALMVKAGFSLNKALDALVKQTKNKYFSKIIADISAKISSGKTFNQALSDHQNVFPPIFLN